jgi:YVTN family beta-propeller protein
VLTALAGAPAAALQQQDGDAPPDEVARAGQPGPLKGAGTQTLVQNGVEMRLRMLPDAEGTAERPLREKEYATVSVEVRDAETGEPVTDEKPAAWIDHRRADWGIGERQCKERINGYLPQKMKTRPVVDLNGYVVMTLNRGNHISVLDPFFGFGSTNVLDLVQLPGVGGDWVKGEQGRHVYVTIPERNQVVDVRTGRWEVGDTVNVPTRPGSVTWGPDGRRLWVATDGGSDSGVTVLDPESLEVVEHLETGPGPHEIVIRPDGRRVYLNNPDDGTVSVVDPAGPEVVETLDTGGRATDLEYSPHSGHLYVIDDEAGTVMVYDGDTLQPTTRITGSSGLWRIDFDPSGRWGFLMNRRTDELHVLDAEIDEVVHGVVTEGRPDQVHFTEDFAYVRSLESSQVMMIGLRSLDPDVESTAFARDFRGEGELVKTETGIAAVHFPAGARAPTEHGDPGIGPAMALAPHERNALYVTNPSENSVYFYHYMEGMPTPNRNLKTYKFEPTAVMTVGRDLDEVEPGVYTATVQIDAAGRYSVNMVLDEPRVIHCFPFDVEKDESLATDERNVDAALEAVSDRKVVPGRESVVAFRVVDRTTGEDMTGLEPVLVRITSPRGWQRTVEAETREDGTYAAAVTVPEDGTYYLSARIPDVDKGFRDQQPLVLRAAEEVGGRSAQPSTDTEGAE